jgi:hypothetical protein
VVNGVVHAGPVRQRLRDLARHRETEVGVPGEHRGEVRSGTRRRGRGERPVTYTSLSAVNGNKSTGTASTGEIEALDVNTGKVEWDTKVPTLPLGAVNVSNDLVFTTLSLFD